MNEQITKPISVVRQEFIENVINDINNCKLPLFVIEYILQDILNTVKLMYMHYVVKISKQPLMRL